MLPALFIGCGNAKSDKEWFVGRLIPAGTGLEYYRNVQLSPELEEAAARVQQEVTAEIEAAERELELMRQEGEAEEMAAE